MTAPIADIAREFCEQQGWPVSVCGEAFIQPTDNPNWPVNEYKIEWLATYEGMGLVLERAMEKRWEIVLDAQGASARLMTHWRRAGFEVRDKSLPAAVLRAAVEAGR
jgi:hypothetical protein